MLTKIYWSAPRLKITLAGPRGADANTERRLRQGRRTPGRSTVAHPVRHQTRGRLIAKAVGGVIGVAATATVVSRMAAGACRADPWRVAAVPVGIAPGRTRRCWVGIGIGRRRVGA